MYICWGNSSNLVYKSNIGTMNKYKGIDLFCGIGGFRIAMNHNNVECVFSSDNDKFAQQTYKAKFK